MLSRKSTGILAATSLLLVASVQAEDGHWSQQMDMSTQETKVSTNRWQGNFPESSQANAQNPWAGSAPAVGAETEEDNTFAVPPRKRQFPDLDYSPYDEGRKKIESRRSTPTVETPKAPAASPRSNVLPNYNRPYYYPGPGMTPYGGGYYPTPFGNYGNPMPFGNYGYPWSGGSFPFTNTAPWGGGNNMPFYDGYSPWNNGSGFFPSNPFSW